MGERQLAQDAHAFRWDFTSSSVVLGKNYIELFDEGNSFIDFYHGGTQ